MSQPSVPSEAMVDIKSGQPRSSWRMWFQFVQQTFFKGDPSGAFLRWGTGSPEAVVVAPVGSAFLRTDGGASTTLYVKESGTGNTGWVAK